MPSSPGSGACAWRSVRSLAERLTQGGTAPVPLSALADALGCSKKYLYKCVKAGSLRAGRIGRDYRVPPEEAARFAREAGLTPDAP